MPKGFGAVTQTAVWAPFEQNVPKLYLDQPAIRLASLHRRTRETRASPLASCASRHSNASGSYSRKQYPAADVALASRCCKDLRRNMLGDNRAILILLMTAVALLLAITCANVAGLLLVRMDFASTRTCASSRAGSKQTENSAAGFDGRADARLKRWHSWRVCRLGRNPVGRSALAQHFTPGPFPSRLMHARCFSLSLRRTQ